MALNPYLHVIGVDPRRIVHAIRFDNANWTPAGNVERQPSGEVEEGRHCQRGRAAGERYGLDACHLQDGRRARGRPAGCRAGRHRRSHRRGAGRLTRAEGERPGPNRGASLSGRTIHDPHRHQPPTHGGGLCTRHRARPPLARLWQRARLSSTLGLDGPRRPHGHSPLTGRALPRAVWWLIETKE